STPDTRGICSLRFGVMLRCRVCRNRRTRGGGRWDFCAEDALEDGVGEGLRGRRKGLGVLPPESGPALHFGSVKFVFDRRKTREEQLAGVGDQGEWDRRKVHSR